MFDRAIPPVYCEILWDYYWKIRSDGSFKISEVLAFKQLTGVEIGEYELNELLLIDTFVENRLSYHRKDKK